MLGLADAIRYTALGVSCELFCVLLMTYALVAWDRI